MTDSRSENEMNQLVMNQALQQEFVVPIEGEPMNAHSGRVSEGDARQSPNRSRSEIAQPKPTRAEGQTTEQLVAFATQFTNNLSDSEQMFNGQGVRQSSDSDSPSIGENTSSSPSRVIRHSTPELANTRV